METDSSDEFNYETPDDFNGGGGGGDEAEASGPDEPPDLGPPMLELQVPLPVVRGRLTPPELQGAADSTGEEPEPSSSTSDHARTVFVFSQLLNMSPEVNILIIRRLTMFQTNEETRNGKSVDEGGEMFSSFVFDKNRKYFILRLQCAQLIFKYVVNYSC